MSDTCSNSLACSVPIWCAVARLLRMIQQQTRKDAMYARKIKKVLMAGLCKQALQWNVRLLPQPLAQLVQASPS